MNYLFSLVLLSLTTTRSFAAPAPQWQGYKAIEDVRSLNLPFKDFAENSVYAIFTADLSDDISTAEIVDTTSLSKKELQKIKTQAKNDNFFLEKGLSSLQISTCLQQKLRFCPLFKTLAQATAFFNNGKFRTCRHVFHNWLSLASKTNDKSVDTIKPPLIIVHQAAGRNSVKYHSGRTNSLTPLTINTDRKLNEIVRNSPSIQTAAEETYFHQRDYISLHFQGTNPLNESHLSEISASDFITKTDQDSYIVGFPSKTSFFEGNEGDAPGKTLVINSGKTTALDSDSVSMASTNLGFASQSGSPLLLSSGEILGMYCSGNLSSFSTTIDESYLLNLWQNP